MHKVFTSILTLAFIASVGFASETVKGAKKDYEQFKKEMAVQIDTAEKKIETLKSDAKVKGDQTKAKLASDLEVMKNNLKKQQAELKYESESGWKRVKKSLSDAADSLNTKIQNALKE